MFLSSTLLDGRFTLRVAPLAHRTHLATLEAVLAEQAAAVSG